MYIQATINGNYIQDVYYDKNGKKKKRNIKFKPRCYIETNNLNCNIKTIHGNSTQEVIFDSIKEYKEFVSKNRSIAHGTIDPVIQYISQTYQKNDLNIKLKPLFYDIEVYTHDGKFPTPNDANYPINSVSFYSTKNQIYYLLSLKDYNKHKNTIDIDPEKIRFKKCETEVELLQSFIKIVQHEFPDILVGYNSSGFDNYYTINRMEKVLGKEQTSGISPFSTYSIRKIEKKNKVTKTVEESFIVNIDGIVLLDYLDIYKKYIFEPRESYKLDFIANAELGQGKVDYSEFDNLRDLWEKNPQLYSDYNIVDVDLLKQLDEKLGLIDLNATITYKAKCNHVDTLGTVKAWESYLYYKMLEKNICLPVRRTNEKEQYPGAYVKDVIGGIYKWLISFDFNSLYPTVIRNYNISPETFIENKTIDVNQNEIDEIFFAEDFNNDDDIVTGSGNFFRKDKIGIIPQIVEELFNERKEIQKQKKQYEKEYNNTKDKKLVAFISQANNGQMALKILLNSLYGSMANKHFIFYDIRFARSITLSAQLQTKYIERYLLNSDLKKYLIKSVYCDTDSIYASCDHLVTTLLNNNKLQNDDKKITEFLNDFAENKIQPTIREGCCKLSKKMNCFDYMNMGREIIAKSGFWTEKKRYACLVLDKEGIYYDEPKLKITGLEIVRSSTPTSIKPFLRNIIKNILEQQDIIQYVKQCKKEYMQFDVEKLAFPRSANNFEKWVIGNKFQKGIPIAVRSALVYNKYIDDNKLEKQFSKIQSGDKLYFLYLKMPNPTQENVFGFIRKFPKEMKKYVDKDMMFELSFMNPVKGICEKIGVDYKEKQKSVNDLF